nr:lipase family protein [uncultured Rhodopila sp.]
MTPLVAAQLVACAYVPETPLPAGWSLVAPIFGNDLATDLLPLPVKVEVPFGFIARSGSDFAVAIRGSQTVFDWIQDCRFLRVLTTHGELDDGMAAVAESLSVGDTPLWLTIQNLMLACQGSSLTITGHSLGGALAHIVARLVADLRPDVVTFAAPRAGSRAWAMEYDALLKIKTLRYEARFDLIPHLPPTEFGVESVGTLKSIGPFPSPIWDLKAHHILEHYIALLEAEQANAIRANLPPVQG